MQGIHIARLAADVHDLLTLLNSKPHPWQIPLLQGFHVARLAADLHNLLTSLELSDVTVVGASMGCAVIWSYIELFGEERLAAAVLVDQAPLQVWLGL